MFGNLRRPDSSSVGDLSERSVSCEDNDVPIYVVESKVRKQLQADIERVRIQQKRMMEIEKSLRRRQQIKVK